MADTNPFASVGLSQFRAEGGADGLGSNLLSMGTAYAIDQSGLKDYLNGIGVSKNDKGAWTYTKPTPNPIAGAAAPAPVAPVAPSAAAVPPANGLTIRNGTGIADQPYQPTIKPNDAGSRLLNNDWHGSDSGQSPQETSMADAAMKQFVPTMGGDQGSSPLMKLASMYLMG
jgi:hypothetical protein